MVVEVNELATCYAILDADLFNRGGVRSGGIRVSHTPGEVGDGLTEEDVEVIHIMLSKVEMHGVPIVETEQLIEYTVKRGCCG